jgi:hypothetical protein
MNAIYTPNYPRLMAADGDKCGKYGKRSAGLVPFRCVKAKGHDGNHLQDVDPRFLRPDWRWAVGIAEAADAAPVPATAATWTAAIAAVDPSQARWDAGSRALEAIYGGRLLTLYPLGSVKDPVRARRCDRLTIRFAMVAGRQDGAF